MGKLTLMRVLLVLLVVVAMASATRRGFSDQQPSRNRGHWLPLANDHPNNKLHSSKPLIKAWVALKQNEMGLRAVQKNVETASDPYHPAYGRHLSWAQVNALVAPRSDDVAQVVEWLEWAGAKEVEVMTSRSWVRFTASAEAIMALVKCRVQAYSPLQASTQQREEPTSSVIIHRCEEEAYEIPRHLDHVVDFVTPLVGMAGWLPLLLLLWLIINHQASRCPARRTRLVDQGKAPKSR